MKLCVELLVILCISFFKARVVCIPLHQFFPFGAVARDERANFFTVGTNNTNNDDGTSRPIALSPSYAIIGRQRTSLHVNVNGVISIEVPFAEWRPWPFPYTNEIAIICPFWDDVRIVNEGSIYHNNGTSDGLTKSRVTQLIQESLGFNFNPTGVFIATWDAVSYHDALSDAIFLGNNTFQCVLATNGQDTFIFFLYADGLIRWVQGCRGCGGYAQVGVDGGDGVNYYSIPNSLTPEIINITHTSNVNMPGLWILKVDEHIIAGPPSAPSDLLIIDTGATEVTLGWTHNSSNAAESFMINCTEFTQTAINTISTVIADPRPTILEEPGDNSTESINNTFTYPITGLEAYTNYICTITARNVFGWSPTSETIDITTNSTAPSGLPENITVVFVLLTSFRLEWSPPLEENRNGIITGYRLLVEWEGGQEYRVNTSNTHYTFTGLQQGTIYYYTIAAETSAGTGPSSNTTLILTLTEQTTGPDVQTTGTEGNVLEEKKALNIGVIGGAGGAAVLLFVLITVTVVSLCAVMAHKRKKEANFHAQNAVSIKKEEANIYNDQKPKLVLKPMTPATKQPAKHYTVDSDHYYESQTTDANPYDVPGTQHIPHVKNQKGTKKPMIPKPNGEWSASEQEGSSDGVYMALNPASMVNSQWSQDQQYMTLSDATKKGAIQHAEEEPQYMNCQRAHRKDKWVPTESRRL